MATEIARQSKRAPMPTVAQMETAMQHAWFALAMAEQSGQPAHALERKFAAYMAAMERFVAAQQREEAVIARRGHVA
jgi:hypothetical protein